MKTVPIIVLSTLFIVSCAGGNAVSDVDSATEICDDDTDNDGDGYVDCDDNDCGHTAHCQTPQVETECSDGYDNDVDGQADCDDADCNGDPACVAHVEDCDDLVDNDGDLLIDCLDPNCVGDPACLEPEDCDDHLDNDGDTYVDCADSDCDSDPACLPTTEISCTNGTDDDGDTDIDCADSDCATTPPCDRCYDSFTDVPTSHWAYDFIRGLYVNEIVDGCTAVPLAYCPDSIQQRKYFAIMLIRAMGESPSSAGMNDNFADLTDPLSSPYVNRLAELNITNGCGGGNFCPDVAVSRQDTAIFLIRALGQSTSAAAQDAYFGDLAGSYAVEYINRLYELNISDGCGSGNYCPTDDLIRSAAATFVSRAFDINDDFCRF